MPCILADGIDFGFVFIFGLAVLVPLMTFEVLVEALILSRTWKLPFRELCRFTFKANCWSLLAGVPTKILNAFLYELLLPPDIPGFFATYPFAIVVGSLTYFLGTLAVEGAYAHRWKRINGFVLGSGLLWRGVVVANVATYAVLAPLHYYATRPAHELRRLSRDAGWSSHPAQQVVFTDARTGYLRTVRMNGSGLETLVPMAAKDYLVSADLKLCLFRSEDNKLVLYRRDKDQSVMAWETKERFTMDQVAFSPTGDHVAVITKEGNALEVLDTLTGKRVRQELLPNLREPSVAWSLDESRFFIAGFEEENLRSVVTVQADSTLTLATLEATNQPTLLICYGRTGGNGRWGGGGDWGKSYSSDECNDLRAWAVPELGSALVISRETQREKRDQILTLAMGRGLLHLSTFGFEDVAFLEGCRECVFDASGFIYLLDVEQKRLGTIANGQRFSLFTSRFQKRL